MTTSNVQAHAARLFTAPLLVSFCLAVLAAPAAAQTQDSAAITSTVVDSVRPMDPREYGQRAQAAFERYRRMNLPSFRGRVQSGRNCPEPVGLNWCYWYDEEQSIGPESPRVIAARHRMLSILDSLGRLNPADNWISGQRVRYLIETNRPGDALAVAKSCEAFGWWCDALEGIALHEAGRYAESEAAYERVLAAMSPREQCTWRDLTPYLDEDTRKQYIRSSCGSKERKTFEDRVWWFSRTRYGMKGNDSRTEHFARLTYVEFLRNAASPYTSGFDEAEREMTVRFGWSRRFASNGSVPGPTDDEYDPDRLDATGRFDPSLRVNVIGMEATPSHRFIPPANVLTSPASSDSTEWAVQLPPVVARYHPTYASKLLMLEHQQGLFRRGDTALVVVAYDVSKVRGITDAPLEASLTVTPGSTPSGTTTVIKNAPGRGTITVKAPWGPLLMSAEVAADSASTLVRARYGIRPPYALGARVSLSDLLFYAPYGTFPSTVEEALPHAHPTQRLKSSQKLGVFWEAYNTNPQGERMKITLVVAPEEADERGRVSRALRLGRGVSPVTISVEDMSARGSRTSPRAVEVDISTLKPGAYLVQLEIDVAGQYVVRADRRIVITGP
ncbi:MAG: hypothetical protein IT357_08185 [Gemmatimonadaceae bacterium]|nr:hypothetical protein [Gemmatimonadaceae bacterium]